MQADLFAIEVKRCAEGADTTRAPISEESGDLIPGKYDNGPSPGH